MRAPLALALAVALLAAPSARAEPPPSLAIAPPVASVSFPFWCDWGYDWDERCWWDRSSRLAVGGDVDKVWRAGVRFDLSGVPAGSTVLSARLRLYFDATCVAPQGGTRSCDGRTFSLDVHPIFTARWFNEREVEIGPALDTVPVATAAGPRWFSWDVTEAVYGWITCGDENDGVLVKLTDGQEDYGVGGPKFASATYSDPALRPVLEVTYVPPNPR